MSVDSRDNLDLAIHARAETARFDGIVIPPVFVSHAVPWLLTGDPRLASALASIGMKGSPERVIVVNSHWHTQHPTVAVFDRGDSRQTELAQDVAKSLEQAGLRSPVVALQKDSFDFHHSLWVPLSMMFGDSPPPVVTLSIQPSCAPIHHLQVGQALRELTKTALVVGSGSLTHNMGDVRPDYPAGQYADWALTFSEWMTERVRDGDVEALLDYRARAPSATRSHPKDDHLLPLFVALGASSSRRGRVLYDGVAMGTVSLVSYSFF
jgi:4,5-DOPA dioxygenase extradiol